MREIGFHSKVFTPLSIGRPAVRRERQGVAIARAIYKQRTSSSSTSRPRRFRSRDEKVFRFVRLSAPTAASILFIGHNIHHVYDIADRFVVLVVARVALTPKAEMQPRRTHRLMEHVATRKASHFDPGAAQRSRSMTAAADRARRVSRTRADPPLPPQQSRRARTFASSL